MGHNVLSVNPLGKKLTAREYKKAWFLGKFFRRKSPFQTFAGQNRMFLREIINVWKQKYGIRSALEIGPRNAPILLGSSIPEVHFVEKSRKLAEDLRKKGVNSKHTKVTVENRDFQKSAWKNHDLIILNEVLTMIKPKDRLKQLKRIMAHSTHIMIIERLGLPIPKLESIIVTADELENMARLLKANNWHLDTRVVPNKDYDYTIIAGKKNSRNGLIKCQPGLQR